MRGAESVIIHRRGAPGLHGDPGTPERDVVVDSCIIYPTEVDEIQSPVQDLILSRLTVVLPAGTDVQATDEITARGYRHQVEGPPKDYRLHGRTRGIFVDILAVR